MLQLTPMQIVGGRTLKGEYAVQPSKNAALPIIVASLLSREPVRLHGIPRLSDIYTILDIVTHLGTRHTWEGPNTLTLHTPDILNTETPYSLVSKMRASFIVMGALLSRAAKRPSACPAAAPSVTAPSTSTSRPSAPSAWTSTRKAGTSRRAASRPSAAATSSRC